MYVCLYVCVCVCVQFLFGFELRALERLMTYIHARLGVLQSDDVSGILFGVYVCCICVCMYVYVVCVCMYVCMFVCMYVCVCAFELKAREIFS